jgi:hypothetical protein
MDGAVREGIYRSNFCQYIYALALPRLVISVMVNLVLCSNSEKQRKAAGKSNPQGLMVNRKGTNTSASSEKSRSGPNSSTQMNCRGTSCGLRLLISRQRSWT